MQPYLARPSVALFLCALWGGSPLPAQSNSAETPAESSEIQEVPFSNTRSPLSDGDLQRLKQSGYRIEADGKITAPDTGLAVSHAAMPMVLEELAGKERLKAMLELDILFNQYGYTNLPTDILGKVRAVAKDHWSVLPDRVRDDLRPYFSVYELEALQRTVPPAQTPHIWLPKEEKAAAPSAPEQTSTAAQRVAPPTPPLPPGTPPVAAMPVPAAVAAPLPAAPYGAAAVPSDLGTGISSRMARSEAPAPTTSAASTGTFSVAAPEAPPHLETAVAASTSTPSGDTGGKGPTTAPAPPPIPEYLEVTPAVFDQFLTEAPYDREVQALLRLVSLHAPAEARTTALGIVMRYLPQIAVDSRRCGTSLYAIRRQIHADLRKPGGYAIAVNPGPAFIKKGGFLLGASEFLLPDSTGYYGQFGIAPPKFQSFNDAASSAREIVTAWGKAEEYPDSSLKLHFSNEQMAGTLLRELLSLDGHLRGWDSDGRHLALRSEANQFVFYRRLKDNAGREPPLIPELKARYDEWRQRPDDYLDFAIQTSASPLAGEITPSLAGSAADRQSLQRRHDIGILESAGILPTADSKKLLKDIPDAKAVADTAALVQELSALDRTSFIGSVWRIEDQKLREETHEKQ